MAGGQLFSEKCRSVYSEQKQVCYRMPKCVNLLVNTTSKESQYWFKKNLFQLQGQWLVISGCMHFLPQVCGALFDTINMFEDKISMYKIDSQHFGFRDQGSRG